LPLLIAGPFSGLLIDRVDRRKLLIVTQTVQALVMLMLFAAKLTGVMTIPLVIVAALIMGTVSAFDWPCRLTYVASLVDHESLPSAVAVASGIYPLSSVLGPMIAGYLLRF